MLRKRLIFPLCFIALLMWHQARANEPSLSHPAQQQVLQILPSLQDSEAERATGAYIPTVGAVLTLDLLRGPNTIKDKPSHRGVRDWAIYLMQTFGSKLTTVPPNERIAFSINFYDFATADYRQLVVISRADEVADPNCYQIWLNGQPYDQAIDTAAPVAPTAINGPTIAPAATPSPPPPPRPTAPLAPTATSAPTATALATDPMADESWRPFSGQWDFSADGYRQSQPGRYDLISYFNRQITGDFQWQADLQFVEGSMGGGLVFNAPATDAKGGAQMISYTADGSYLQWGYFDQQGVFQFQGGANVPSGSDGKPHTLAVRVARQSYSVLLNGRELARDVPLARPSRGYVGLLVSTSQVIFTNITITEAHP